MAVGNVEREIAEELFTSFPMVGKHVSSILNKTRAANHTETAAYVGNQQKWDTLVKERSKGNGSVVGLP